LLRHGKRRGKEKREDWEEREDGRMGGWKRGIDHP
jgi:hypothetical protein